MQVLGIGNVTECNKSRIHINNERKQVSITSTPELLMRIRDTASDNYTFYERMHDELFAEYEKRKAEVGKKYHYITDKAVTEAFKQGTMEGLTVALTKDTNNEEYVRQHSLVYGIYEMSAMAIHKQYEAHKLFVQARDSLKG